jgi:hypothetical protein
LQSPKTGVAKFMRYVVFVFESSHNTI